MTIVPTDLNLHEATQMSENKGELTEIGEAEPQKQTQSARQGVIFL